MQNNLVMTSSPHLRDHSSTQRIMQEVCLALLPAGIAGVIIFGWSALMLICVSVATCVLSEFVWEKLTKQTVTIGDWSAVVTGLLLAYNLPANAPWWLAVGGGVIAIVLVKQMFGGIGQNFVNPAMTARIILMVSFPTAMARWTAPLASAWSADAVTTATPMASLAASSGGNLSADLPSLWQMLVGYHGGSMGEVCALALLVGGVYLIIRRVISPIIPAAYIGTVAVWMLLAGHGDLRFVAYELLGGGLLLGAFFMATDYATSPITAKGKWIFGIGCGIITSVIRLYGSLPEGVSFSIILMNILVPHIERLTLPRAFGAEKEKKEATK